MLDSTPSDTAEMFAQLDRRVTRVENRNRGGSSLNVDRTISDTTQSTDTIATTLSDATDGFIVGTSSVGRDFL